jgi:putative hydrolase of the HAD superfamily
MIQTVIFDLDDTLYDEIDYCHSGFACVAEAIAYLSDGWDPDAVLAILKRRLAGGQRNRLFDATLEEMGTATDAGTIDRLVALYRTHRPRLVLPAESRDVLEHLRRHYILALLTDGYLPAQRLKVEALGLGHYFHSIVYTEQLGRAFWKPSPRGFERLIDLTDTPPERMAYIGDNASKDFIAPNALGMVTIQVLRPARLHAAGNPASHARPHRVIGRLADLPALLRELG